MVPQSHRVLDSYGCVITPETQKLKTTVSVSEGQESGIHEAWAVVILSLTGSRGASIPSYVDLSTGQLQTYQLTPLGARDPR